MLFGRSYSVNIPPSNGKFVQKYPALAQVPFILDWRPAYHRTANAYLIDRALGLWSPDPLTDASPGKVLSPKTVLSYAQWLANFLEWAEIRSVDLLKCTYSLHLAGQYQTEMLQGLWSEDGKSLASGTVNLRVQQACDFINWMIRTGLRTAAFEVPYTTARIKIGSANSSIGHLRREVLVREGNPRAMLSAGNLNTAALTLFLALHLSAKSQLPWLIIDDPVQSMDEMHISQFAALLRTLAKQHGRQVPSASSSALASNSK